jgi:hypothetical protein
MREQIVRDIIGLMSMGLDIGQVQRLIAGAYGLQVQAHGVWKIYHTGRGC